MRCYHVKFQSCLLGQLHNFQFCKISLHIDQKLCDRGTWNFFCKEYPYGLIYKKNFKFLGRTVSEKNTMLTCKISKLFIKTIVQLWVFASYHRIYLENCTTKDHEKFFCKEYLNGLICKMNFKFLGRTVSEKNAMLFSRNHRNFIENCATEEHEIFLQRVS